MLMSRIPLHSIHVRQGSYSICPDCRPSSHDIHVCISMLSLGFFIGSFLSSAIHADPLVIHLWPRLAVPLQLGVL
jgi:hypothetical protein